MKNRRTHRPVVRRFIGGLLAAALGVAGSLTVATPGQAAATCALTYNAFPWGDPAAPTYYIDATIKNTGTTTSTNWGVSISFPAGTSTLLYWNVKRSSGSANAYVAADWNKAIQPRQSAGFGFQVAPPPGVIGTPSTFRCRIL